MIWHATCSLTAMNKIAILVNLRRLAERFGASFAFDIPRSVVTLRFPSTAVIAEAVVEADAETGLGASADVAGACVTFHLS